MDVHYANHWDGASATARTRRHLKEAIRGRELFALVLLLVIVKVIMMTGLFLILFIVVAVLMVTFIVVVVLVLLLTPILFIMFAALIAIFIVVGFLKRAARGACPPVQRILDPRRVAEFNHRLQCSAGFHWRLHMHELMFRVKQNL